MKHSDDYHKKERLEARITPEIKSIFQKAADLQGRTLSDFVIQTVLQEAQKVIQEHELFVLNQKDSMRFVQSLLEDAKPNTALLRAAAQYKQSRAH